MVYLRLLLLVSTFALGQIKAQEGNWPKPYDFSISSEAQLSLLKLKERNVNNLYNYKQELRKHLKQIQLAIKHSRELLKSVSKYHYNVFYGFKLLRHLSNDWPQYLKFMNIKLGMKEIELSQELLTLQPTTQDFIESLKAMYRLQTVYNLDAADMAGGILDGRKYNVKLWTTDECLNLGLMYQSQKHYDQSEYWLQLALSNYEEYSSQKQQEVTLWKYAHLLEYMVEAHKGLGNYLEARQFANELLTLEPRHTYMLSQLPKLIHLAQNPGNITVVEKDHQHQKALCTKSYKRRSENLHCYYASWSPFLRLAPIKMEDLSKKTYLNILPDFISQREIDALKNAASPNLQRSELSGNCSCKVADLSDATNNIVRNINQRIMDVTGFKMAKNNMLQVVNYGLAGNYNPDDTENSANDHQGNALIYLSNAKRGGHIVFDSLDLKVKPIKGSMLIWANPQETVLHHQCPLLRGNMWLASKRLN